VDQIGKEICEEDGIGSALRENIEILRILCEYSI